MALLETLTAYLEFANALKRTFSHADRKIDYSLSDRLSRALRTLYFPPGGILDFLRFIESGKVASATQIQQALTSFNDRQWKVSEALDSLEFDRLAKELRLNLATVSALDRVRNVKSGLRKQIQDEINYYGQRDIKPDKRKVRKLIKAIEALNESVEEADKLVNSRAKFA